MDSTNSKRKWKYFLSSIDTGTYKKLPSNNLTITTKRNIGGLAREFAHKLLQQERGTGNILLSEAEDKIIDIIHEPAEPEAYCLFVGNGESDDDVIEKQHHFDETASGIEIPVADISQGLDDVDIVHSREHKTPTPSNKNIDMKKSCSSWSISKIAEYFIFDKCVTKIEMPTLFFPHPEKVQTDICRLLQIVKSIDLEERKWNFPSHHSNFLKQLISITGIETGSRLVLDALLVPLCTALGLKLEVEKKINCNLLPNCIFDYCIRKGENIIGCVEAKSVKSLSGNSIAQAVLQLIILQTTLYATETPEIDILEFPVFAIVTDGHRFIYMQLKGLSLGFEHEGGKLKIRKVQEEGDFEDILNHIRFLVEGNQKQG